MEEITVNVVRELLEHHGLDETKWGRAVIRADEKDNRTDGKEGFTSNEKKAAFEWTTCACGELASHPAIEVSDTGVPGDEDLLQLGGDFNQAVENNWPWEAAVALVGIERRVKQLIGEWYLKNEDKEPSHP